jgi:hypothetical protein
VCTRRAVTGDLSGPGPRAFFMGLAFPTGRAQPPERFSRRWQSLGQGRSAYTAAGHALDPN